MNLEQVIAAAGMTPPARFIPDRWMRFPGIGKGRSNRAGWCRIITPTLAIYGDFASGLSATWCDETHKDDAETRRLLAQARARERAFAAEQKSRQSAAAVEAEKILRAAKMAEHPYLHRKGFGNRVALVHEDKLIVPVRDVSIYTRVISLQQINAEGEKRFLPAGRTRGGIYRIGAPPAHAQRVWLCEGYATGLSIDLALQRLPGPNTVIVCFSAQNLELVAQSFPKATVCADNDESKAGERVALATGLKWSMPPAVGTDFNDLHKQHGIHAVTEAMRVMY